MKLKTVEISGLYGHYGRTITLNDEGLTYIHSLNGVGKSTAMKMVCDLFKGDVNSLAVTPFKEMILTFDDVTVRAVNGDDLDITAESEGQIRTLSQADLKVMFSITYLSPDRNIMTLDDGRILPSIDVYSAGIRAMLEEAKADTALVRYAGEKDECTDEEFIAWCSDLKESLDYIGKLDIIPKIPEGMTFPPTIEQYLSSKNEYEDLAYSLEEWIGRQYYFAESMNTFLGIINGFLQGKKIVINEKDQLVASIEIEGEKITLPLDRLSAGEKQIIIIFSRILFDTMPGSLVILDEPEISLHVSWQKRIGPILLDLSELRDLQILVATHSPIIIHDRWDLTSEMRA